MLKLLGEENLMEPLREFGRRKPIFGTCAGAILLANEVSSPAQASLGLIDVGVERNAYGRQVDSRVTRITPEADFQSRTRPGEMEAVFIRAPIIRRVVVSPVSPGALIPSAAGVIRDIQLSMKSPLLGRSRCSTKARIPPQWVWPMTTMCPTFRI